MDQATWAALAATLTVIGLVWTWVSYQRRGAIGAMRAFGFTMLPAAAYLSGTLEMFTEITTSVADWASGFVFNPFTWTGIGLAGFGVAFIFLAGILRDRQLAAATRQPDTTTPSRSARKKKPLPEATSTRDPQRNAVVDDDTADIGALLRKHGIE